VPDVERTELVTPSPQPSRRLSLQARTYFLVQALGAGVAVAAIAFTVGGAVDDNAPDAAVLGLRVVVPLLALTGAAAIGLLRWRRWRYELRDEELDLLRGVVVVTRTLVPIMRVQHVDTRRTWLADQVGVQTVVVHTAAGSHEIPGLLPHEAAAIRDRIALLARQPDEL
jgi:uncharacterized protein